MIPMTANLVHDHLPKDALVDVNKIGIHGESWRMWKRWQRRKAIAKEQRGGLGAARQNGSTRGPWATTACNDAVVVAPAHGPSEAEQWLSLCGPPPCT